MQRRMKIKIAFVMIFIIIGCIHLSFHDGDAGEHSGGITKDVIICSDCHSDWRSSLSHTFDYVRRHQFFASQRIQVCSGCHKVSFCSDCHANKEEIKPSDKFKDSPERFFPHRGDYITRHKIDGRINPAPCMKCHGRTNNARCKRCHR